MLVTHTDIKNQPYHIIAPIAICYNINQYRSDTALGDLENKANSIGGNAIIGFKWSPILNISNGQRDNMMAQGTAVLLTNKYKHGSDLKHAKK